MVVAVEMTPEVAAGNTYAPSFIFWGVFIRCRAAAMATVAVAVVVVVVEVVVGEVAVVVAI